ncbi:MAG: CDP-alcohol phosphatidyltransferase family protein [Candidatus Fimenecus sp.]
MANIITSCRILCSILMLFSPAFSVRFYIMYLLCGLTDMIDGTVARKTNTESKFGARLDTVADFIFIAAALVKILPVTHIPSWLWIWIIAIAIIKISNVIWGFVCKKRFIVEHTLMNKITGILLFLLPMTLHFIELKYSAVIMCSVATVSAIQEGYFIRTGREIV